jgi:tRNA G26 N,N-dimethylase Trm1
VSKPEDESIIAAIEKRRKTYSMNRTRIVEKTARRLQNEVSERKYLVVGGKKVAEHFGVSQTTFHEAVKSLESDGYNVYYIRIDEDNPSNIRKVLTLPNVSLEESLAELEIIAKL